jgi:galactoside O-acetyltransferase
MGPLVPPAFKPGYRRGKVIMEKHSGLGAGSVAFEGAVIGEGTVVGALSVVKGHCAPWSIYGGVPVKKLKNRKRDLLKLEEACLKQLFG